MKSEKSPLQHSHSQSKCPSGREGVSQPPGLRSPLASSGASPREARGALPRAAGRGCAWPREVSIFRDQPGFPHPAGTEKGSSDSAGASCEPCRTSPRPARHPRPPRLHLSSRGPGSAAVGAPATLRPLGARLLPARVQVCASPAASWGQQRKGGRGERCPRRRVAEEAEAPRGAGSGDPNSGGAAPRTRSSGAAAGRASGLRVLLPGRAAAAAFALGRAAAAAAASPARAGPLSAGAGGCSREGGSGRPRRARSGASARPRWPCPERRVRVSNNGAKRRREPRVRPAVVEEVAGLRVGWAGRRPPVPRSLEFACAPGLSGLGLPSGSPTAARAGEYGASARVNLVLGSLLFSSSRSSFTSCRCRLWVPGVWEYNSLPLQGDWFVTT